MLSIVTPAFNEALNLPDLYSRLVQTMSVVGDAWEWVVVDDHSEDETFAVIGQLAARDPRVRGIRLARNSGSHAAITCALHHAAGDAAVMLAGDLQDPPEVLSAMLERWRDGAQVVWAVRRRQPGEPRQAGSAALYYWIMRHFVGMKEMPARGSDVFLVDRVVMEAFRQFQERNVSVLALITWLGFRQEHIAYDKQPRAAGRSGWTLARKIKLVIDSVTSFSDLPIRLCSYAGVGLMLLALLVPATAPILLPSVGAGLLLVLSVVVGLAGVQLLALGIVGEYVFRALDESRHRPPYLIEMSVGTSPAGPPTSAVR